MAHDIVFISQGMFLCSLVPLPLDVYGLLQGCVVPLMHKQQVLELMQMHPKETSPGYFNSKSVFHRPEVRKLLLFYFYFFLTWSWKIIQYLLFLLFLFLDLKLENYSIFTFLLFLKLKLGNYSVVTFLLFLDQKLENYSIYRWLSARLQ